jgi:hypothetical protein
VRAGALLDDIDARSAELTAARAELRDAPDKAALLQRIDALQRAVQDLEWKFNSLVVGLDVKDFDVPSRESSDLKTELERLFQPLVVWLKELTAEPREIEIMRSRLAELEQRVATARGARERARAARSAATGGDPERDRLRDALRRVSESWDARVRSAEQQRTVLDAELATKQAARVSLWDKLGTDLDRAVRTRGLNLLLATAAFLSVFLALRFVQRRVSRISRRRGERTFPMRLLDVVLNVLVVLAAVAATLVTLYAMGDWVLLAVALIFLLGAGWAAIKMVPQYFEQVRLMLNLGAVREGERILVDGLPWRVDALKLYTSLTNPDLQGGVLRVPLRDLIGQRSRPMHDGEPWFPCRVGDFVLLADGARGKVLAQTPEVVVLRHQGSERTWATTEFLGLSPSNLSRGYSIDTLFGVDYSHQADATRAIPERFESVLKDRLPKIIAPEWIKAITADFRAAGASSLDIAVSVELDGAAAADYGRIQRAIWRSLVDACTEHGWGIPFPQLTVHQAG